MRRNRQEGGFYFSLNFPKNGAILKVDKPLYKMDKETIKYKNIASIASTIMLLLAIPDLPYGYYTLLRWVVTVSAIFLIYVAFQLEKKFWLFLMVIIALLFNPIAPIHLDKETWVIIDFVVAILFLVSIFKIKSVEPTKDNSNL